MGTQTEKIIGTIGAMQTLIENFPMSIFDYQNGVTLTDSFQLLLSILSECGVDINEIVNRLLNKMFGVKTEIHGGIDSMYQQILDMEIDDDNEFLNGLEYSVKSILCALLASIFSCSAVPVLPDKYMDVGKIDPRFTPEMREAIKNWRPKLTFPIETIDLFNTLSINPFSNLGKLYYKEEGKDVYYKKEKTIEYQTITTDKKFKRLQAVPLYFDFGEGHADYVQRTERYMTEENVDDEVLFDSLVLKLGEPLSVPIKVTVQYNELMRVGGAYTDDSYVVETIVVEIPPGKTTSSSFNLSPFVRGYRDSSVTHMEDSLLSDNPIILKSNAEIPQEYTYISISPTQNIPFLPNNDECIAGDKYVYLDAERCDNVIKFWYSRGNVSMSYLKNSRSFEGNAPYFVSDFETHTETVEIEHYTYKKQEKKHDNAIRYNNVPNSGTTNGPDYIVAYEGLDVTSLYKTNDMNSFLWYVLNRGKDTSQIEKNKCVWDSRLVANKKYATSRNSAEKWNEWYNSKETDYDEFSLSGDTLNRLYPIVQLSRNYPSSNLLTVDFSAQKYYKPTAKPTDNTFVYQFIRLNRSLYEFNWEYLENIRIFQPKVLIFKMFDALLRNAFSLMSGFRPSVQRMENERKLSNAIIGYINAIDANVEDCYFTFSNEEFDQMLEDMFLSRYGYVSTYGENSTPQEHNIDEYFNSLDEINPNASQVGTVSQIMKTITQVSATKEVDGVIDYNLGFEMAKDESWWKQFVYSIALSVIESIFTPQVVLLIMINFKLMGVVSSEDLFDKNQAKVISLVINKIFGMVKSIIEFIKDKLQEILLELVQEYVLPLITQYMLLISLEKIQAWIDVLTDAMNCLLSLRFNPNRPRGEIDDVNYADIVNEQLTPESNNPC